MNRPEGEVVWPREPSRFQRFITEAPSIPTITGKLLWVGYNAAGGLMVFKSSALVDEIAGNNEYLQGIEDPAKIATFVSVLLATALGTKVVNPIINRVLSVGVLNRLP